ncbi:hypothetical protein F5Y08DRAFT_297323 [Xylaria arbuscula]|nr:hypothetical protein F5Y08DRAFT_297323 [Xylaria arbuscula]
MWLVLRCIRCVRALGQKQTLSSDRQSADTKKTPNSCYSRLEGLPAELKILILSSAPDLPTLNALVRSSPILHAQYLQSRNRILRACLGRELDGLFIDAYAFERSRPSRFGKFRRNQDIIHFLDEYRSWLSVPAEPPTIESLHPDSIKWMVRYHLSIARPLVRLYSSWALSWLKKEASSSISQQKASSSKEAEVAEAPGTTQDNQHVELSRSEEIRLLQALYRYETYHHLFGENSSERYGSFMPHVVNEMFLCQFDPWDVEAFGCIDMFVRSKYEELFDLVKVDLHPDNIKFRQPNGVYNPCGSYDLTMEHDDYMDGTVAHGLMLLMKLLRIQDHEQLVSETQKSLDFSRNLDSSMCDVLDIEEQFVRRDVSPNFPNSRDKAEQRRDPMIFVGDSLPPHGPPFAWVALWNGKYSNIYGGYVPPSLRQWGYVMWDQHRLISMGMDRKTIWDEWEKWEELSKAINGDYDWCPRELP